MTDKCDHCGAPIPLSILDPDWCDECSDVANDNTAWDNRRGIYKYEVPDESESW